VDRIVQWRWRANRSSFGYLCRETEPSNYYVQAHVCVFVNLHRPVGMASLSEQTETVGGRCHSSVCWEIAPNIEFRCLFSLHHSHPLTLSHLSYGPLPYFHKKKFTETTTHCQFSVKTLLSTHSFACNRSPHSTQTKTNKK